MTHAKLNAIKQSKQTMSTKDKKMTKAKLIKRLSSRYDKLVCKDQFKDDGNIEENVFGISIEEILPETEVEQEAREEWEPKAPESPELLVFKSTCSDISAKLYAEQTQEVIIGHSNSTDSHYDGGDYESLSTIQREAELNDGDTLGERDQTTSFRDEWISAKWLRNAYAEITWSFGLLSPDQQEEFQWRYRRLKKYIALRAKELGIRLAKNDFCNNRDYLLDYEEKDFFQIKEREEDEPRVSAAMEFGKFTKKSEVSDIASYFKSILKNH